MSRRGAFIVIEGLDRSGKTTQTSLLLDRLEMKGKQVKLIKFPGQFTVDRRVLDANGALLNRSHDANWQDDRQLPAFPV